MTAFIQEVRPEVTENDLWAFKGLLNACRILVEKTVASCLVFEAAKLKGLWLTKRRLYCQTESGHLIRGVKGGEEQIAECPVNMYGRVCF